MLQKWHIGLMINFFQYGVKIPNRLMRMNNEDEVDFIQGWTLRKREAKKRHAQTMLPRNDWALLLCRVMSAKSKSARPAQKPRKKLPAQPKVVPTNSGETKSHSHEEELFARGIELFNTRYFFEAHEAWEEIWLHTVPPEKKFLQGLIQVTAAFHHHSRENLRGTKSLLRAGLLKLEDFPTHHRGLNLKKLREVARRWLAALDRAGNNSWPALPRITPAPRGH
jgi:hypothetical protein